MTVVLERYPRKVAVAVAVTVWSGERREALRQAKHMDQNNSR